MTRFVKRKPLAVLEISKSLLALLVAVMLGLWIVSKLWPLLLLILTASVFAIGLLPVQQTLVRRGLTRPQAVTLIVAVVLVAAIAFVAMVLPPVVREFTDVQTNLPETARKMEDLLRHVGVHVELQEKARQFDWKTVVSRGAVIDYGQQALVFLGAVLLAVLIAIDLLLDVPRLSAFARQFIPAGQADEAGALFASVTRVVSGYLIGQLITSAAIGIFTTVILVIVGVPDAVAFGALAAFADLIPELGAFVAVITTTGAALQRSGEQAVIVFVLLLLYHQFEGRILLPRVYGRTLHLPPIVVLIAALCGAALLGIPGVLLALPVVAAARVVAEHFLARRQQMPMPPKALPKLGG